MNVTEYYEKELAFIREMSKEFSASYSDVAGRMQLKGGRCADPHVERLIEAPPLSAYALSTLKRGGLVLGYAGISPKQVRDGVRSMKSVLGHL